MCYILYLSTDSEEDLSLLPHDHYMISRLPVDWEEDSDAIACLGYPNKWLMDGQYGGCSCHFRHLGEESMMRFGPPEDWCPEDADDVGATIGAFQLFSRLTGEGHGVDVVDVWSGKPREKVHELEISVGEMPDEDFRFFENYKFNFVA